MATGYVKIYGSILGSSVWAEDAETRVVWITMLALADQHGKVEASESGLARFANVSIVACRKALGQLAAPDLDSKSPEYGGRRVEKVDGGWLILNYLKYREMRSPKQVADAERQKRWRKGTATPVTRNDGHGDIAATVDVDESVSVAVKTSSSTLEEVELAAKLPTNQDRIALTAVLAVAPNKVAWLAEMSAALEGMHGPPVTEAQLGEALRDYVANGLPERPTLAHFRSYIRRSGAAKTRAAPKAGVGDRSFAAGLAAFEDVP